MLEVQKINQVSLDDSEEILTVSAELRFDQRSGVLTVYMKEGKDVFFLPEESQALKEQFNELIGIFPQLTEHGFSGVKLSRLGGNSFRKPFFNFGLRWNKGYSSLMRSVDGYWDFTTLSVPNPEYSQWGNNSCDMYLDEWVLRNITEHQKTWTMPYDRPRSFIPELESRGVYTPAQVRHIRFFGHITENKFYTERGM
jgi:hypothetical protein